jgi:hypothetical protein
MKGYRRKRVAEVLTARISVATVLGVFGRIGVR